jgi:hypothetical protein
LDPSDLLGVFKEAYEMGAMILIYSMFQFCPFFGLQNFLCEKSTFQFRPTLGISGSLPFKDKYLISTLIPTYVSQDVLEKTIQLYLVCEGSSVSFPKH